MMSYLFLYTLAVILLSWAARADPTVSSPNNGITYHGTSSNSVEHFQNIRYAHDTSGARRFAPPEPFIPSDANVDATSPGPACPQLPAALPPYFSETKEISEDCLNLRIARPAGLNLTSASKLPVVVWLHGGGVVKGSAYDPHFDPDNVIKLSVSQGQPIIYIAMNYRLNIFGFARLPILKSEKSLNVGMRDQRVGFQWVKDNIEVFGGDSERITVYGLSAGGTFTSLHPMAYGGSQGVPFQQAWMMSGPPGTALNLSSDATTVHTTAVAERLGCGELNDSQMLQCLRDVPWPDLRDVAMEYSIANHPPAGLFTFIPSLDDDFIPDRPSNLVRQGKFAKGVKMIFGWCQDDGTSNAGLGTMTNSEEDMAVPIKSFASQLTADHLSRLYSLYPASDFERDVERYEAHNKGAEDPTISVHYFRLARIMRDILFTCPSINFGYQMLKETRSSTDPNFSGVRLYDLNQTTLTPLFRAGGMPYAGVTHGSDTNYIFNGVFPEAKLEASDVKLSAMFTSSLVSFAHTGNPIPQTSSSFKHFGEWPEAFSQVDTDSATRSPSKLNIEVVGGPWGTASVTLVKGEENSLNERNLAEEDQTEPGFVGSLGLGKLQEVMSGILNMGPMDSVAARMRQEELEHQKLFERCAFIDSLNEVLGV